MLTILVIGCVIVLALLQNSHSCGIPPKSIAPVLHKTVSFPSSRFMSSESIVANFTIESLGHPTVKRIL